MIRQLAILAVAAVCLAASTTAKAVTDEADVLKAQKTIFTMTLHQFEGDYVDAELLKAGRELDFESQIASDDANWGKVVREFWDRYKFGMLPRGRLFSLQYPYMADETELLFRVFYYAPDVWTLIHTIIWAKENVNEYQFAIALHAALLHRSDTRDIRLPPIYQFLPEYFFNTDVMKQVYDYKMSLALKENIAPEETRIIEGNYTNWYITHTNDPETDLTYFTEDIGFNNWYFYYNQRFPFWMSREKYPKAAIGRKGEIYYYVHKFIANRYYMERLSNGLGAVEDLDWEKPIMTGYYPYMIYPNGMHFPQRKEWSTVPTWLNEYLDKLRAFDSRIAKVVDSGYFMTEDGKFERIDGKDAYVIMGDIIQGNYDSPNRNYYGSVDSFGRRVLGFSPLPQNYYQVLPSALEQYSTSLRDPAFYRLYNKVINWFSRYQEHLGPRTSEELAFDGVTIESANILEKQLFTYFERVDTLINKFWWSGNQQAAKIKVRQYRLNHKPFTYNIFIHSLKDIKASIRIFLGPKYNIYGKEISDNWKNFYEIDYFVQDLKKGKNTIERKSTDAPWYTSDYEITELFEAPVQAREKFEFDRRRFGLPYRILLPKGKPEGMPFQFFYCVSEFVESTDKTMEPIVGVRDNKPLGFPLDRPMFNYTLSNMYLMDAIIVHKDADAQINLTTL